VIELGFTLLMAMLEGGGVTPVFHKLLFTRLVAFRVPIPVAKSQPVVVPYAGKYELLEVESTPFVPEGL
jgi:hypothetical protein